MQATSQVKLPERSNKWLTRSVLGLGLTSLFSDMGREMVTAILPMFLLSVGGSAATLGLIEEGIGRIY